ncbi:MAG: hypothetical protein KJ062_04755 [Thermoanaerobaculia bacterium]|nr:hypothetical protein [Thermoanaerobaculia bacterium]
MATHDFLAPEIRALLASHRELQERLLGPTQRIIEDFRRQNDDLIRPFAPLLSILEDTRHHYDLTRFVSSPAIDEAMRRTEIPVLEELRRSLAFPALATGALSGDVAHRLAEELSGLPAIARVTSWYTLPPLGGLDPVTLHALLVPLELHASFAADTFVRLEAEASDTRRAALATALRHSAIERDLYADVLVSLPPPLDPVTAEDLTYSIGPDGREELLARADSLSVADASIAASTTAHDVALLGGELLQLLGLINAAARAAGRPEIFPPTSRLYAECPVVCLTIARTVADVARIVNALFLLLYEGGGSGSLRLLTPNGGPLEPEQCDAIWWLKELRRIEFHDLDHGDPTESRRKWRQYGETLSAIGLQHMPSTPEEFAFLQRRLYEGLVAVLRRALAALPLPSA